MEYAQVELLSNKLRAPLKYFDKNRPGYIISLLSIDSPFKTDCI